MFLVGDRRASLLTILPRNQVVVELGVAGGESARPIFDALAPQVLHLIDPWAPQNEGDYRFDPGNKSQEVFDVMYKGVLELFSHEIELGRVKLHRMLSSAAAKKFEGSSISILHIDANHTEDAVLSDLISYDPLVRKEGVILLHDFANHDEARARKFGVIEAVRKFLEAHCYYVLLITREKYPTIFLVKEPTAESRHIWKELVREHLSVVTEIPDGECWHVEFFPDGNAGWIPELR